MKRIGYISFLLAVLFACSEQQTRFRNQEAFESYLNEPESGFISSAETKDFVFETRLIPPVYEEGNDQLTVQLRISRKDGASVLDYGNVSKQEALTREGYLSFEIAQDVALEYKGKAQPVLFHHYERNYGIKPSVDLLFHFSKFDPKGEVHFTYRDQLFSQGLIKIEYNKELFTSCHVQE